MGKKTTKRKETPRHVIRYTLRIWLSHLMPFKWLVATSLFVKLIANLSSNILVPIEIGRLINRLATGGQNDSAYIESSIVKISILLLISISFEYIWNRLIILYLARAKRNLEADVFKSLINKSWTFHAESFNGAVVSQFNRFMSAFQYFHDTIFRELFSIFINFTASLIVILFISSAIGTMMFVWTVIYVFLIYKLSRKRFHRKQTSSLNHSKVTGHLSDVLANILTIKIFARESFEISYFRRLANSKMLAAEKSWVWSSLTTTVISTMMAILNITVLLISTYSIQKGIMTIGTLVLIQVLTVRLSMQLWQLGGIIRDVDRSFAESGEMTEILTYVPTSVDTRDSKKVEIKKGEIELKNVQFQYPDENSIPKLFDKLSLSVKPGEKVGIVGPSGSGKTTVVKLIMRLAYINDGSLTIDGMNINDIPRKKLRDSISFVPQEPILFHRSILDNIRYSNPDASKKQIEEAAKRARADIFIKRLPKGYETLVGERGVKLSSGQRQRIAIARAMLKPSPILILDEATSAIDSESEKLIQDSIDELMESRTTIIVAHRFSTIKKMDRIIYMSYGKVIEQGTHQELIAKKGVYAKLWAHQTDAFIEFN